MCFEGRRTPWNRCSGPKLGLHQCPCVNQAYRTTFTVTKKGALLVVKQNTCSETRHTFVFALTVNVSRAAKTTCFPQRNEDMLYAQVEDTISHLLGRSSTVCCFAAVRCFPCGCFCRHFQLSSVQMLWCGILRWTLTQFGRCVHAKRGWLIHVVGVSTEIGCVSVDVWPTMPNMSLIHATH